MRTLIDTHTFLWFVDDSPLLSSTAREILSAPETLIYVSVASAWEIAIKVSIGKLQLNEAVVPFFEVEAEKNGFLLLPVTLTHIAPVEGLPFHHRDPFDRLLISQCIVENMPIISADAVFDLYAGITRIW